MQRGRIFPKGPSWFLRYREPIVKEGKRGWRDVVVRLAPRSNHFKNERSVEHLAQPYLERVYAATSSGLDTTQTVKEFIEFGYFPNVSKRPSTITGYEHMFNKHVKDRLADKRVCDFRAVDGQVMLDGIAKDNPNLSHNTLKHIKHFLTGVFTFAVQRGLRDTNPMRDVAIPKGTTSKGTHAYTPEEIVTMMEVLPEPARTVVAAAAFTGLRRSELRGLQWGDIDGNQIYVRRTVWNTVVEDRTKTESSRAPVPLVPVLKEWLEARRDGKSENDFIFEGERRRRPLNLANLARRVISPALQRDGNGVKWRGWHGFRRGLVTNLYAIGTKESVIQDILRHADVKITRSFYIKPTAQSSQRAMKGIEKLFKSLKGKRS